EEILVAVAGDDAQVGERDVFWRACGVRGETRREVGPEAVEGMFQGGVSCRFKHASSELVPRDTLDVLPRETALGASQLLQSTLYDTGDSIFRIRRLRGQPWTTSSGEVNDWMEGAMIPGEPRARRLAI